MNAKTLTLLVALLVSFPAGYAAIGNYEFWESCEDPAEAVNDPNDTNPYYVRNYNTSSSDDGSSTNHYEQCAPDGIFPDLVTGHTVYAKWVHTKYTTYDEDFAGRSLGLPTDFAALAGYYFESEVKIEPPPVSGAASWQRECVVWFNGQNLDMRPDPDAFDATNDFPSDEDEPGNDTSFQDYDFDRDVAGCGPEYSVGTSGPGNYSYEASYGTYAVVVEEGDCNPVASGGDYRFRAFLDFSDPNGIYHEVQEYDYTCLFGTKTAAEFTLTPAGADGCPNDADASVLVCAPVPGGVASADVVKQLFPWTASDPNNENGCAVHATPADNNDLDSTTADPDAANVTDPANHTPSASAGSDPGHFDLGNKCNGTVQDLFTERLWMTRVHAPQFDARISDYYTFALMVDTCDGLNIFELEGKSDDPTAHPLPLSSGAYDLTKTTQDAGLRGLHKWCTDGSSFSFDDTNRGSVTHDLAPTGVEEIMRGNSEGDGTVAAGKHRENCRANDVDWAANDHPPGTSDVTCYPEDHRTAAVDLFIYDTNVVSSDLFDLFELNSRTVSAFNGYSNVQTNSTCAVSSGSYGYVGAEVGSYDYSDPCAP